MSLEIRSVPNKEIIIPFISEENFAYLKSIPEEKVKEEAKINARVGNFVALKSLLQEVGVPSFLSDLDFPEFDKEDEVFKQWIIDNKVIMPFTKEYHPQTGVLQWKARMIHPEYAIDIYGERLSDLFVKQMYFQYRQTFLVSGQKEIVFIDRWLVANSYEDFETMQKALEAFQARVEKFGEQTDGLEEKIAEKLNESVPEA
jgi:hypothetical protein|nr:MAG TPA: hypothetical protein [Caudoviricetes sp.]